MCVDVLVVVCVSSTIIIIVISAGCTDPVPFIPSPNRSTYRYYIIIIIILKRRPIGCSGGSNTLIYIIIVLGIWLHSVYVTEGHPSETVAHRARRQPRRSRPRKFFFLAILIYIYFFSSPYGYMRPVCVWYSWSSVCNNIYLLYLCVCACASYHCCCCYYYSVGAIDTYGVLQ